MWKTSTEECYSLSNTPSWVLSAFFKLYKWCQIAKSISKVGINWWEYGLMSTVYFVKIEGVSWNVNTLLLMLLHQTCMYIRMSKYFFLKTLYKWWKAFHFILKALFILKIFSFLSWLFGHVEKTAWLGR